MSGTLAAGAAVEAVPPVPSRIEAIINEDSVRGLDWPDADGDVLVEVLDMPGGSSLAAATVTPSGDDFVVDRADLGVDLVAGMEIIASDADGSPARAKTLVLEALEITTVDPTHDLVGGMAPLDPSGTRTVEVTVGTGTLTTGIGIHGPFFVSPSPTDGSWTLDVSAVAPEFTTEASVEARLVEYPPIPGPALDATVVTTPPHVRGLMGDDAVVLDRWFVDNVLVEVFEDPDDIPGSLLTTAVVAPDSQFFVVDQEMFSDPFDLQPGMAVRATDLADAATEKLLILAPLAITEVDRAAGEVTGTSPPDVEIDVVFLATFPPGPVYQTVTSDATGSWVARMYPSFPTYFDDAGAPTISAALAEFEPGPGAIDFDVSVTSHPTRFTPVEPFRLEDTRPGGTKVGSADGAAGPLRFNVLGRGGLPLAGVDAVSLNVTVAEGESPDAGVGYVTVDGCSSPRPVASNLNFRAGQTVANAVITPVSSTGDVCVYVYGSAHVLVDVNGYFPSGGTFGPVEPYRLVDTRSDGTGQLGPAETLQFNVLGRAGLPASGVDAVSLNVTVVDGWVFPFQAGYVTVHGCLGGPPPDASNLNYDTGDTVANAVITPISPSGDICLFVSNFAHVLVDVNGYFPTGGEYDSVVPHRLVDTRATAVKIGSADGSAGPLRFNVLGRGGLPTTDVSAVSLNVTATQGEPPVAGDGYVTVDGCATPRPYASNLNFRTSTVPNAVLTPVSPAGDVCVYLYGTSHILVDVNGYFPR